MRPFVFELMGKEFICNHIKTEKKEVTDFLFFNAWTLVYSIRT